MIKIFLFKCPLLVTIALVRSVSAFHNSLLHLYSTHPRQRHQQQQHQLKMSSSDDNDKTILVVGSANQDLISKSDVLPTLGETVMGKEFSTACGGKGANQAVAAAMLGLAPGMQQNCDLKVWIGNVLLWCLTLRFFFVFYFAQSKWCAG